jgi:hypothetical protein
MSRTFIGSKSSSKTGRWAPWAALAIDIAMLTYTASVGRSSRRSRINQRDKNLEGNPGVKCHIPDIEKG